MTRALVLGGTRFVGRAVVEALLPSCEVTVLNRGTRPLWDPRIVQLTADRREAEATRAALGGSYDVVVDVSGTEPAHVRNVLGTPAVSGAARYVYIGSASVYERGRTGPPFREGDPAGGDPVWNGYAEAKAECERLLSGLSGPELTVLRPPYVYGPHNTEPRERFLWARMLAGQPVFVPGSGRTRIQFCHVSDLARTVAAACAAELPPGVYNVGEPGFYTFAEYLDVLADAAGVEPRLVLVGDGSVPARDYFPFRDVELTLDTTRLDRTGAGARTRLAEGLRRTLTWLREFGSLADEPTEQEKKWRATTAWRTS
ncbi:NAD-dependent epimerase/dehydratase family protein [Streptosporangium carneum]|uniref:Epimerase n=1 Tax=Streptosporangium carneum TaxID=47481 RepID=A0A9W6I9I0_9ACTN|nr:NAD-dependent epimerase/dehydratase family protein [Streptosporangium carneum]GLK13881.1 epimerase [Streptosporangium carneum]